MKQIGYLKAIKETYFIERDIPWNPRLLIKDGIILFFSPNISGNFTIDSETNIIDIYIGDKIEPKMPEYAQRVHEGKDKYYFENTSTPPKDYLILSFKDNRGLLWNWFKNHNLVINDGERVKEDYVYMLENSNSFTTEYDALSGKYGYQIYTVNRIVDGVNFTVKDKTNKGFIQYFIFKGNVMYAHCASKFISFKNIDVPLSELKKP